MLALLLMIDLYFLVRFALRIHAGLLTEDYIRTVDTTFTVAARRFLPARPEAKRRMGWLT